MRPLATVLLCSPPYSRWPAAPAATTPTPRATAAKGDPIASIVLVYNVEYGGRAHDRRGDPEVDADVVGVLESYARLPEIASRTGYPYYNTSLQILSKYPILEPSGGDGLYGHDRGPARLRDPVLQRPPRLRRLGPARAREGRVGRRGDRDRERGPHAALERPIEAMRGLLDDGYPVFLTGDFNEPSSLDYTELRRSAPTRASPAGPVAGQREAVRSRLPRQLPRDPPRPGRRAGDHTAKSQERGSTTSTRPAPSKTIDSKLVGEPGGEDVEIE